MVTHEITVEYGDSIGRTAGLFRIRILPCIFEGGADVLDSQRRREAAAGHSIPRFFWRLSPLPFASLPVVACDAALNHLVAPAVRSMKKATT